MNWWSCERFLEDVAAVELRERSSLSALKEGGRAGEIGKRTNGWRARGHVLLEVSTTADQGLACVLEGSHSLP